MKIKKIKKLKGTRPVYNMEVEKYENYACQGGLIVHNCYDSLRYGLISYHSQRSVQTHRIDYHKMSPDMIEDYRNASKEDRKFLIKKWNLIKRIETVEEDDE